MKKKILAMAFAACLVFGTAAAMPSNFFTDSTSIVASADDLQSGDYTYHVLDDGTVGITGYTGSARSVSIKSTIANKKVTVIEDSAFADCTKIASLTIPSSVKIIRSGAFKNCTSLTSITIPSTVNEVGYNYYGGGGAFENCTSLRSAVVNCGNIAGEMFNGCTALSSVSIGSKVTEIAEYAFKGCSSLTSVTIPDSVTYIGAEAFSGCKSMSTAKIGNGVTDINGKAFLDCKSLSTVTIGKKVKFIGQGAFANCISLTSVTIPSTVKEVGYNYYDAGGAFEGCTSLTSATINGTVIGEGMFKDCTSLKTVKISNTVKELGHDAFNNCTSIASLTLGTGITGIGYSAFYNCSSLKSISIPNKVAYIGDKAFRDCIKLTTATIGSSVDSIGEAAFYNCKSMTSVKIGNNVSSIGEGAFAKCISLTSVTIPTSVAEVGYNYYDCGGVFEGCTSLKNATINGTVIGEAMFKDCTSLTRVSIRNSVTEICKNAFRDCTSLAGVIVPGSVKTIGTAAFCGCENLKNAYLLDGVVTVGESAFEDCTSLGYVYISNKAVTIENSAFCNIAATTMVCPKSVVTIGNGAFGYKEYGYWDSDKVLKDEFRLYCYSTPVFAKEYAVDNDIKYTIVDKCSHTNYKTLKIDPTRAAKGYTLHMCTRCGHTYKDNYTVLDLTIKTQPKNVTVSKAGATATFTVSASGTGLKYEWYVKDPKGSWTKTGATTNKYSVSVTAARNGRQVFCKVIDASKKYVKSNTVTAKIANTLKITTQPKNVTVSKAGNTATFSVTASGTGLKYEWYIKDVGGNWTKVGSTSNKYSVAIKQERNGRQVFCKVIDKSGKFVKSNIVNAHIAGTVVIISQPSNVTVSGTGKTASFSVKAAGTNMKYEWYIKDRNGSWTKTGSTTNKYSVSITKARNGRQVFCKVIDKSGKYAKSRIVTAKIK